MYENEIDILRLFNYKADRLERSEFRKHLLEISPEIPLNSGTQNKEMLQKYPSEEYVDACVLTVRLFIQNNERISICNIKKIYDSLPIGDDEQSRFDKIRNSLNAFLDNKALLQTDSVSVVNSSLKKSLTKKDLLDAFVYGELSHLSKRTYYDNLCSRPFNAAFYSMEFAAILKRLIDYILDISKLNQEVITELSADG